MMQLLRCCTDNLLISITVCFILGASAAFACAAPMATLPIARIVAPLLLVPVAAFYLFKPPLRLLATLPFFFLVGLLHTHHALLPSPAPDHIDRFITEKTKATLIGRVATLVEFDGEKSRFELTSEELLLHTALQNAPLQRVQGRLQLSVPGDVSAAVTPGMKIMAIASLDRLHNYRTPGAFNYRLQMATKSIACSGWVRSVQEIIPIEEPSPSLWQRLHALPEQVRQTVMQFLNQQFDREVAGIYQALLIGSMVNISPQLLDAFKENGCMHVLSISGLHLSLLGLFAVTLLNFLLKRSEWLLLHTHVPSLALILTAPLLFFYTFIAGMNIPALRSLATALLVLFAVVLRRQRSLLHIISAAALIVLVIAPLALFTPSFQLSFAAVLAINCIYPRLPVFVARPESDASPTLLTRALWTVQSMIAVSLAATAGTLPFMLYHFNRFSVIGPIMNLIIEPLLCLWALPCGLLSIPVLWISPGLAALIAKLGSGGILLTLWITKKCAGLPYASLWTITPSLLEIALFFAILYCVLQPKRTTRHLYTASALALLLTLSFTRDLWSPITSDKLTITFLDVGQGSATLVQLPHGKNMLIDGGGPQTERFDPGQALIAPFLWRQRIWRLDTLIITHPHKDHYIGMPFIAARFQPHRLIVNGDLGEEPAYRQFLDAIANKQDIQVARAGDILEQDKNLRLDCLGMNGLIEHPDSWSTNDRSLVVRLRYGARTFLFPGDISTQSEDVLLTHHADLRADILLAPHHGSRTSAGPHFISQVKPSLIVASAGATNQGALPASEHLRDWAQQGIVTLVTAQQGTITCTSDGQSMRVRTFTGDDYEMDEKTQGMRRKE